MDQQHMERIYEEKIKLRAVPDLVRKSFQLYLWFKTGLGRSNPYTVS